MAESVEWVDLKEATARLSRSSKTIERLVTDGDLKSKTEPRPGRRPERLYHAGDLERLKYEEERGVVRPRPERKSEGPASTELTVAGDVQQVLRELMERFFQDREADRRQRQDAQEYDRAMRELESQSKEATPLWLTWRQASKFSGIPVSGLKELAAAEKITARKFGRSTLLRLASLESFEG